MHIFYEYIWKMVYTTTTTTTTTTITSDNNDNLKWQAHADDGCGCCTDSDDGYLRPQEVAEAVTLPGQPVARRASSDDGGDVVRRPDPSQDGDGDEEEELVQSSVCTERTDQQPRLLGRTEDTSADHPAATNTQ